MDTITNYLTFVHDTCILYPYTHGQVLLLTKKITDPLNIDGKQKEKGEKNDLSLLLQSLAKCKKNIKIIQIKA